jgi:hypothetical protein
MSMIKCTSYQYLLALMAVLLTSCQSADLVSEQTDATPVVGKVTDISTPVAGYSADICRDENCVPVKLGTPMYIGDKLDSDVLSMEFTLQTSSRRPSSHKLLGQMKLLNAAEDTMPFTVGLEDGTFSGKVANQPIRIDFISLNRGDKPPPYCEIESGDFIAINYIVIVFKVSGGSATCTDGDSKVHKVTNGTFEGNL